MKYDWSKENISSLCSNSSSYAQVLKKMGAGTNGSTYATLKLKVQEYGIDISHMTHKGHNKGKSWMVNNLDDILIENSNYTNTHHLKNRLWKSGRLERRCYSCGISEWMGKEAPLQLDHINGNRTDNRIENLRILCPNCHSQTETWTGKNKPKYPNR